MSIRANPAVIGAFVVGAVALLLVALLIWGGTGVFRTKLHYVLFFDSSVTGLAKGAPVLARGVKVGEVTDVQIRWGTPLVAVYIALEPDALKGPAEAGAAQAVERAVREDGIRAQLRMQSFVTGVLYVALDPRPGTSIVLRGIDKRVPELPTIPTDIEVWTAKLERFAEKIDKLPLEQISQSAAETLDGVKKIVQSRETQELVRNANAAIADARTLVQRVDAKIDPLIGQLEGTLAHLDASLDAARKLALDVDARVDPLATRADGTLDAARAAIGDLGPVIENMRRLTATLDAQSDPLLTSIRSTSDATRATMERAQLTLGGVDRTLDQESPLGYELFQTMKELRGAAFALRSLADYLERFPDAPIYGLRRPSAGAK
jgi:phospholipid/cholesterol/gamma-HCH transport system substrate-binding protein